ncbi:superoxide dismutase family protein [Pontibacter ruber]|uniref:Superoxide dismutase family protein n=1 Tax=Pontibacter ruber TaxID=1343895 RepID=A0ABW5CYP9_9BACT|nr:superoxide dismutase family protein [Pontibacter ruber]
MKNLFLQPSAFLAVSTLFVFSACSDEEVAPDATMAAKQVQESHRLNSLNQNKTYTVDIMPLNNSGVSGTATLMLEGDMLTVHVQATGLEPDALHPQHIHGFKDKNKNAVCPPMSADTDRDGLVELAEGLPYYGDVLLSLTPFSTAPDGTIDYKMTFDITKNIDLLPLQNDVIVLHGMTVNGTYEATLPIACGQIRTMNNGK